VPKGANRLIDLLVAVQGKQLALLYPNVVCRVLCLVNIGWYGRSGIWRSAVIRKVTLLCFSLIIIALISSDRSESAVYDYHPSSPFALGNGVDPYDPLKVIPSCIEGVEKIIEGSTVLTTFDAKILRSRRDLFSSLNISANLSARYSFYKGSGGVDFESQYSFSSNNVVWIVKAYSDFGRKELRDTKLRQDAADLIKLGNHDQFAKQCGTELVLQERRSAIVAAVFSLNIVDEFQKTRLETRFSGGATTGVWSADVAAAYKKFVSEAAKISAINVSVIAIGGTGIVGLSPVFEDFEDLEKISKTLREYAAGINFNTAAPSLYYTGSMHAYGWQGNSLDASQVDVFLSDLYFALRDVEDTKTRLKGIISTDLSTPYGQLIGEDGIRKYIDVYNLYVDAVQKIYGKARDCAQSVENCTNLKSVIPEPVSWPTLPAFTFEVKNVSVSYSDRRYTSGNAPLPFGLDFDYTLKLARVEVDGILISDERFVESVTYGVHSVAESPDSHIEFSSSHPLSLRIDDVGANHISNLFSGSLLSTRASARKFRVETDVAISVTGEYPELIDFYVRMNHGVFLRAKDKFGRRLETNAWWKPGLR
jgi:hypothetical protein